MQITKIKQSKGQTTVSWSESTASGDTLTHTLTASGQPAADFMAAFDALTGYAGRLCELTPTQTAQLRMSGVTLTHGDERGIVITCLRDVSGSEAPMVLNTPHITDDAWPRGLVDQVRQLEALAVQFIGGVRDQGELFGGAPEAENEEGDEDRTTRIDITTDAAERRMAQKFREGVEKSGLSRVTFSAGGRSVTIEGER